MLDDVLRAFTRGYYKLPGPIRYTVGSAYRTLPLRLRLGPVYREFDDEIKATEYWTAARHRSRQWERIRATLDVAFDQVPYYRNRFTGNGIESADIRSFDDFRKLPFLTKQDVKEHLEEMTAKAIPRWKWLETTTGGSTLNPMRFFQVRGLTRSKERAFIQDQWGRFGYRPGARAVQLKGRNVGHPARRIFWEYEPIQNFLEMNSQFLTEENLPSYVEAIIRFKPEFLIGYVSSIFLLARYLESHPQCRFPPLRGLFLASENVYPWQRTLFSRTFNCPICAHYGHSEMVLLGAECPYSARYHFYPQYGYLEVIGADGKPCTRPGQVGELVGTSFDNPLMPFIRYRTQDYGVVGEPECPCGRHYPVIERIEGRLQEFIVTRTGRLISVCVMGAAHFDVLDNVHQTQYYQDTPGRLIFRIVPKIGFSLTDLNRIQSVVQAKTGNDVEVEVQVVKEIPRTESGKHRMIVQKLDIPFYPDAPAGSLSGEKA
jgi:phenylacetate-CoA ligase